MIYAFCNHWDDSLVALLEGPNETDLTVWRDQYNYAKNKYITEQGWKPNTPAYGFPEYYDWLVREHPSQWRNVEYKQLVP
jgi:hypothetical protein